MGDRISAAEFFSQAVEQSPQDHSLLDRAIIYALMAGEIEQASTLVKKNKNKSNRGGMTEILIAIEQFSEGSFKKTIKFDAENNSDIMQYFIVQALRNWSAVGLQEEKVDLTFNYSEEQSPALKGIGLYSDGFIHLARGQDSAALASLEQAWSLGIQFPEGVNAYARLNAEKGDMVTARLIVEQFYKSGGESPLIDNLDEELRNSGEVFAPRFSPQEGAAVSLLGFAFALATENSGDIANLYYSLALLLNPAQDAARLLLATSLRQDKRPNAAIAQLNLITSKSLYFGAAKGIEAWILYEIDDKQSAVGLSQYALSISPKRPLKIQVAALYQTLEMYVESEKLFDSVMQEDARQGFVDWRVLFARAGVRDKLDRWNEAEADLIAALGYAPERPELLNYLGYSWINRGINIEKSLVMIKAAAKIKPNEGYILDSLGWAYFCLNEYDKAVRYLEKAAALEPTDPVINDHLGDAYWRTGRLKLAQYQWSRVIASDSETEVKESAKRKLSDGLEAPKEKH